MSNECPPFATKAELEELKQQINTLLGKSEDGSETLDVIQAGTLEGTAIQSTLALALTGIASIVIKGNVGQNLGAALASGAATFEAIKINGAKTAIQSLTTVGKTVGKNAAKVGLLAAGVKVTAEVASVALALVSQGANTALQIGTLNLIKQNTANNEFAFNSLSRDYSTMMGFISKNKSNIADAEAANNANQAIIQEQKNINTQQIGEILQAQTAIASLQNTNAQQAQAITQANADIAAYKSQVEAFEDDIGDFKQEMEFQVIELESALLASNTVNEGQNQQITQMELENELQNNKLNLIESQLVSIDLTNILWRQELRTLLAEHGILEDPSQSETKDIGSKTIIYADTGRRTSAGGGTATAVGAATKAQNGIIDLAEGIVGVSTQAPPLTNDDTYNNTGAFGNTLADLISQIQGADTVNEQQMTDLRNGIKLDMESLVPVLLGATVVPGINAIKSQTTPSAISSAAATGVCSTTAPGGCMQQNVTQPLQNQMGQLINSAGTAFSAANNALLQSMSGTLNAVKGATDIIKGTTNATLGIVSHATHGLAATKSFLDKAWKSTEADKILNGITTAVVIHNAVQISGNLAYSIGETASVVLDAIGIRDQDDNPIDINGIVKAKLTSLISSFIGTENYKALGQRLAKYNRIYQASANVLDATQGLFDSARSVAELTAENTGKIGNALLESGTVYENAYDEMVDEINPQSRAMRRLERFRQGLEAIEDGVSTVGNIASEVVETKDNFQELKEAKEEWKTENEELLTAKREEKEIVKEESKVTVEVEAIDFSQAPKGE